MQGARKMMLSRRDAEQMESDRQLFEAWVNAVALGNAWWAFADLEKKKRFRELQQAASSDDPAPHMGFRHALEAEIIGRLSSGELKALGIEYGTTSKPMVIPKNFFWKGAEIDLDGDTVAALGRRFGQVTVQGDREPLVENSPEVIAIDLKEIPPGRDPVREVSAAKNSPANTSAVHTPRNTARTRPAGADSWPRDISGGRRGRPSKTHEIEEAIDMLLKNGVDLAAMPRPRAYKAVRKCAEGDLKSITTIGFSDPVIQRALFRRFRERR
jgi:hypothetical protein